MKILIFVEVGGTRVYLQIKLAPFHLYVILDQKQGSKDFFWKNPFLAVCRPKYCQIWPNFEFTYLKNALLLWRIFLANLLSYSLFAFLACFFISFDCYCVMFMRAISLGFVVWRHSWVSISLEFFAFGQMAPNNSIFLTSQHFQLFTLSD